MEKIGDLLKGKSKVGKEVGANSERAEQIAEVLKLMGEDNSRFKYWLGRTRKLAPEVIYHLRREAEKGKNPAALIN